MKQVPLFPQEFLSMGGSLFYKKLIFLLIAAAVLFSGCAGITLLTLQSTYRDVAEDTLKVVVQVNTVDILSQEVPNSDGWDFFFPDPGGESQMEQHEFRTEGLGSGVIVRRIDESYYVVTNNHVVGEADEISITLHNGRTYEAAVIGKDPRRDLSVVSFTAPGEDLPVVSLGDSDDLRIGDLVVAVGNPFGYNGTVTSGLISGLHRSGPTDIADFIQTDASINQGNSGGALVDLRGRLIGINTWITTPTGGSIGLGFAIPINSAKGVINQLIDTGRLAYGWLGVSINDPLPDLVASLGEELVSGAVVTNVYLGSPAYLGGIRPGDIILKIGRRLIENSDNLIQSVSDLPIGSSTPFVILRKGERLELNITVSERADDETIRSQVTRFWPGLRLYPLTGEIKKEIETSPEKGVYVLSVDKGSPAETAGIRAGDIIVGSGDMDIVSLSDFYRVLGSGESQGFTLSINREGEQVSIDFPGTTLSE